jgi:osmotically-inducible protein OsmY
MRRAGQKRTIAGRALTAAVQAESLDAVAVARPSLDEMLTPDSVTLAESCAGEMTDREAHCRALERVILQRIQTRLPGRIRYLHVRVFEGVVTLGGQCATYYTKQLAQHTAMGVIEDEHLENSIIVSVPR